MNEVRRGSAPALEVKGLDVYYGHSHALQGVDLMRSGGFTSIVHADAEISQTVAAFDRSLEALQREGLA